VRVAVWRRCTRGFWKLLGVRASVTVRGFGREKAGVSEGCQWPEHITTIPRKLGLVSGKCKYRNETLGTVI
jgi:hypothetical protein